MQIFGVENRKSASLAFGNRLETPENPDRCADPERPDRIPGNGQTETGMRCRANKRRKGPKVESGKWKVKKDALGSASFFVER